MPNININVEQLRKYSLSIQTPMYGGVCCANYTSSLMQLHAMFAQYGLNLRTNFLANESLIPRARNYCVDEFMRSGSTHMIFIDADVGFNPLDVLVLWYLQVNNPNEYDIIGAAYPKKCLHHSNKVITEDGIKTIADIVNNKYTGRVYSYNKEGKLVLSKITNHWVEPNKGKKWVSLRSSKIRSRNLITVTEDHEVAYVKNIFDPKIDFIRADETLNRYVIAQPSKTSNRLYNALYNKDQLSALIGISLGDGCLSNSIMCRHGEKQREYVKHKANILNANLTKDGLAFSISNAQTKELSKLIKKNSDKTLKNILPFFNEISLAYLYMDDGNLYDYAIRSEENGKDNWWVNLDDGKVKRSKNKPENGNWIVGRKTELRKPTCSIATMSFSKEDNYLLSDFIKTKFGIDSKILFQSPNIHGEKYPFISFDQENTKKLHKLIAPYIHSTLEYKLIEEYRNQTKIEIDNTPLEFAAIYIDHIVEPEDKNNSKLYDIEVENTHNFIANGVLVHNCISWEKIKLAVNSGVCDDKPANILENFVGDFVFNPVPNPDKVHKLDEPMEVLEIGTGFMLMPRETYTKYLEHYPEIMYKPDHARSEFFDGSREIPMYYQAEIDQLNFKKFYEQKLNELIDGKNEIDKDSLRAIIDNAKSENEKYTKRYLSEDYLFCQNSRKAGMKVWLCPWIQLNHQGTYSFGGSIAALNSIGASLTADMSQLGKPT